MVHSSLEYLPGRQADNKFYNGPGIANSNYDSFASKPTTPYMKINMSKTDMSIRHQIIKKRINNKTASTNTTSSAP